MSSLETLPELRRERTRQNDLKRKELYRKNGWCIQCADDVVPGYVSCLNCLERTRRFRAEHRDEHIAYMRSYHHREVNVLKNRLYSRKRTRRVREEVISHYGGVCAKCGDARLGCLEIHHTNHDGADHRREMKLTGASSLTAWIYKNHFPEGFEVLCANCHALEHWMRTSNEELEDAIEQAKAA